MINRSLNTVLLIFGLSFTILAQKPVGVDHSSNSFFQAMELYTKAKYNAAADLFDEYIKKNPESGLTEEARYYQALCSYELFHPDAIAQFEKIIHKYPGSPKSLQSSFQILRILYREKKYKEVIARISETDISALEPVEEHEYYMMKGFSSFKTGNYDEAKESFGGISLDSNKYYFDANYYKGYIHYQRNEYDLAELCFKRVLNHSYYGQVAPTYLSQIYLKQLKFQEAFDLTDTITRKELFYEALHISGVAAYHLKKYNISAAKYEQYYKASKLMNDSDWYMAGKSHSESSEFEKAIYSFNKIPLTKDSFSQITAFELGYVYMKSGKKENARSAFQICNQNCKDLDLCAESGYYYNLLSVELYNEHAKTIESIHDYIEKYPKGSHTNELKDILSVLLLNTKQYQKTLDMLEHINDKTPRLKMVLQKSAFCRGEELYSLNDYEQAGKLFNKSLEYPEDPRFKALAGYWLAEISYKENKYEKAIKLYNDFIKTGEAARSVHYSTCFYNIAWCYLKQNNYTKAAAFFKEFNDLEDYLKSDQNMLIDGHIRLADCRFMLNNYSEALNEYNWVITKDNLYHDYALFQKGILYGLMGKQYEKINTLAKIPEVYEESDYLEKSLYELGYANFYLDKYDEAIDWFDQLIAKKKNGNDVRRAQLNIGLILKKQNKISQANEQFQYIITKYTQSEEAKEALVILKQTAIENGNLASYNSFVKSVPGLSSEAADNDSDIYEAVTNALLKNDTSNAIEGLTQYIQQFPQGNYILTAHYTRAEIYYKQKKYASAIEDYEWIATIGANEHTERAVKVLAGIYYLQKNYEKAFTNFEKLEPITSNTDNIIFSLNGQMRCAKKLQNKQNLSAACKKIMARKDIPKDIYNDARYELAGILYTEDKPLALTYYKEIIKGPKNLRAAESKYMIAKIQFDNMDSLGCKKTIKELNRDYNDFDFWVAKGFLLLADDYILMRDTFQAKATLNSLIDNYEPDAEDPEDVRKTAKERLDLLQPKEQPVIAPKETETENETEDEEGK